ncbi:TetR/AcrR family transcriptional regulator [Symmachiella dynata]|uniref:TetR/AcrR family transcriptional regulator n=1 Tax=Symmachiella dynata TaxID=2527995 RepID=UPI0018D36BCA|nr:TetR/AcrR family transcriptional regulator [Symmachiella dynata]
MKKQEIFDRGVRILELARARFVRGGYLGLGLNSLAAELGVSRGTIYNHFKCKEEIILALLQDTMEIRLGMYRRAAAYQGTPRVRMTALGVAGELFVKLYPDHFCVERVVQSDSIWGKTTEERRALVKSSQLRCVEVVAGVVRDGVAQNHITLPADMTPESLVFGLWAMTDGAYSIIATSDAMIDMGIAEPFLAIRRTIQNVLDGFGWTPLSADYDFDAAMERIVKDVFPEEYSRLKQSW